MGLHLIALLAFALDWPTVLVILEVAFGLGMVIFVHELGHFAVAKWCGVKCEKFYLGFDIYGLKLAKMQWGETEYGIGILPLGGYVKMLGQDDNPAKAAEERERSLLKAAAAESPGGSNVPPTDAGAAVALDPRSYMAKSVPQRMAIISAGVIMNVIFAYAMAAAAYSLGVKDLACGVSAVLPGEAAWRANLQPGDMIVQINDSDQRPLRYRDLIGAVALADLEKGVDFTIARPGVAEPFTVNVRPEARGRLKPTIGVLQPLENTLSELKPVFAGTAAAEAAGFQAGDKLVAIGNVPIANYADQLRELTRRPNETLAIEVERATESKGPSEPAATTRATIQVPPQPMRTLGLVMRPGEITAVQPKSPAAEADLQVGDRLVSIDGQPCRDMPWLAEQLRRKADHTVTVALARVGGKTEEKQIKLRNPAWPEESAVTGSPVSLPALGVTVAVSNVIEAVDPQGPAASAKWKKSDKAAASEEFAIGDEIVKVEFQLPKPPKAGEEPNDAVTISEGPKPIELSAEKPNWPYVFNLLQNMPEGTVVKLTIKDGRVAEIEPAAANDWFSPDRGLINAPTLVTVQAESLSQAIALAGRETKDSVMQVYAFLRKIGTQISVYGLGGPVTIAKAAGGAAQDGLAQFLIFLTMLSANLAVINFLPIPLLDGGHMVFLALEGIMRRPVNERVVVAFHYVGFAFIISLMLFVLGLDIGLIQRPH